MELGSLLSAVMLYMANMTPDGSAPNGSSNSVVSEINTSGSSSPTITIIPESDIPLFDANKKAEVIETTTESTAMMPYDFDCSMPYPPTVITDDASDDTNAANNPDATELPHAKATFSVPIHTVHKLPDSAVADLHRFVDYCEDKIFECYSAIKDFNNYNYEKNQEIQYLSYTEKRKQEIIEHSQELKAKIEENYNKMHQVCGRAERHRHKITTLLNPFLEFHLKDFAQPKRIPKVWYDIHNLETVILQLFTPLLRVRTYYDHDTHALRMSRMPVENMERKEFIPLSKEYLNDKYGDEHGNDGTIDGASMIMENNHPDTNIDVQQKPTPADEFNSNILEQHTYSSNKDIQQIIIYYVFKFYELKVQDGTRKVFHYTRLLKQKKRSDDSQFEINNFEDRLAVALKELQADTIEMERNRVIPELIGVYNAENAAHDLLPYTKYVTKLIGMDNKRVITAFNPSQSIEFHLLDVQNKYTNLLSDIDGNELAKIPVEDEREELDKPLEWDENWTWVH